MNRPTLLIIAVLACGILTGAIGYAAYNQAKQIRNVGTIQTIGIEVYADEALTSVLYEISWGTLSPGEARSFDAWVKNTGNDAQKLTMWTESWEPAAAQDYLTLGWSYSNEWIPAGAHLHVTFTLSVDSSISSVDSFSFDIWIQATNA